MMNTFLKQTETFLWGWPLIAFVVGVGIVMTAAFNVIQVRRFSAAWRYLFQPAPAGEKSDAYITPLQAFVNTLSASIGNGSLAGMATAIAAGGPGAAFWIFVLGFFTMAIRFAEVYASGLFVETSPAGVVRGGPMVYLKRVPGGQSLPYFYAFFCLMLAFVTGNGMQCNTIRVGMVKMTGMSPWIVAVLLFVFLLYVMLGGATRIIKVSDRIIPIKVGVFFLATLIVLLVNAPHIVAALKLILIGAFTPHALGGGLLGYTIQSGMRFGMSRLLNATEAGLGTSGILFGSTPQTNSYKNAVMSLASVFITNYLVCFVLMLVFVVTGTWNSGLEGLEMTIAAYSGTFGSLGSLIVTFLSVAFGLGCLVTYAYIGRECWSFLFHGKYLKVYAFLYSVTAPVFALTKVSIVWNSIDIVNAGLLSINLYGLCMLLGFLRNKLKEDDVAS